MPSSRAQQRAQTDPCNEAGVCCTASRHGSTVGYHTSYGCTCPPAVAHSRRWQKQFRIRKARGQMLHIDATGTRRRIQALVAIGWTLDDLGGRLDGITPAAVSRLGRAPRVHVNTARKVTELYLELANTAGPSQKSARRARTRGWLTPLWWDDDTIDDPTYQPCTTEPARPHLYDIDAVNVARSLAGEPTALTRAERLEVVRQLHHRGAGYRAIANHLGCAQRQVHRDLVDLGLIAPELEEATA